MLWGVITIILILIDQLSKWYVSTNMHLYQSIPVIQDVFHITYCTNKGAAFSILQNHRAFFVVFTLLIIGAILLYVFKIKAKDPLFLTAVSFVLAGAVGNLIDRIRLGEVIDFFDFCLINFAIFNVADICVCVGAGLMLLYVFKKTPKKEEDGQ